MKADSGDPVVVLLEELVAWTRFAHQAELVTVLNSELADAKQLLAFEFSDGRSQKEVGDAAGLSQPTISGLWKRWRRLGLARELNGRTVHIARPSDLGLTRVEALLAPRAGIPDPAIGEPDVG